MPSLPARVLRSRAPVIAVAAGLLTFVVPSQPAGAQATREILIEPNATTNSTIPRIVLDWPEVINSTGITLYRRSKGASSWTAQSGVTTTGYADIGSGSPNFFDAAAAGTAYEYSVNSTRSVAPNTVYGAIVAGYNIPLVNRRGKVLLVVDNTMAAPLAPELAQLQADLAADGWSVFRMDTPREKYLNSSTNPAYYTARSAERQNLRSAIAAYYNTDPFSDWALLIIGHVPVAYSGALNPDGHPEHYGAWPTDSYYADVNGTWTDTYVNVSSAGSRPENINVPGDGKFDQFYLPSPVEMQAGRVDLYNMPAATPAGLNETDLLRQYLVRNHRFRAMITPYDNVARRMIVDDDVFGFANTEAFAASGWRAGINFFGRAAGQVDAADWFATLQSTPMLLASGTGPGEYDSAVGIGFTGSFGTLDSKAVFTLLFGSFFGDWDHQNSFLRAPLAGTSNSLGLSCVWSGRPWTHLNHMALGDTLGYCVRYTQNAENITGAWFQNDYLGNGYFFNWIHIGLMGDPTLRLHSMQPVTGLTATTTATSVQLNWTASPDATAGYHVYRASTPAGPFTRRTSSAITASGTNPTATPTTLTMFTDTGLTAGQSFTYLVKAVRMETTPSGTYANQSLGAYVFGNPGGPETPVNLTAAPGASAGEIVLNWSSATGALSYEVQRSTTYSSGYSTVGTPASPGFTDTGRLGNQTYFYRVRAIGSSFNSGYGFVAATQPYLPPGIAGWRYLNFQTTAATGNAADNADPDHDGLVNLAEYIVGDNPNLPYTITPPISAGQQIVAGEPRLTLTFLHNKAATDPVLTVEVANSIDGTTTDINPLSGTNQYQVLDNAPYAGLETITVQDTQPVSATGERYMRLAIDPAP